MEMIPIVCPRCGGSIHVPVGRKTCFCTYCGSQLYANDGSTIVEYRVIDEARIREAETSAALELKKLEIAESKRKTRNKIFGLIAAAGAIMLLGGFLLYFILGNQDAAPYLSGLLGITILAFALIGWYTSSDAYQAQNEYNQKMLETMASIFRRK